MRIHTNASELDIRNAARKALVGLTLSVHKSRTAAHGFECKLTGSSNRRANDGSGEYAATWDQWGVFLAAIFDADPDSKCWAYSNSADFHHKTNCRFEDGWPADAHGDHTFVFQGVPLEQGCTKCDAVRRWGA